MAVGVTTTDMGSLISVDLMRCRRGGHINCEGQQGPPRGWLSAAEIFGSGKINVPGNDTDGQSTPVLIELVPS